MIGTFFGIAFVVLVILDVFETIILPRTVVRRLRPSNLFFDWAGRIYVHLGRFRRKRIRQAFLVSFGPLCLLCLLLLWAILLMVGWALIIHGTHTLFSSGPLSFPESLYFSGVTFITLGYGDYVPLDPLARVIAVLESGSGFGYIALVIGYVPVLYNAFSRREVQIILLDTRAGSEPIGYEILLRHARSGCMDRLEGLLKEWEVVAAQLLESYLSYPILAYYRSQHDSQSWLRSLTAIMDACALIESGIISDEPWAKGLRFQARATFAMARHVVVDLAYILDIPPNGHKSRKLDPEDLETIRQGLSQFGLMMKHDAMADTHLAAVRNMYEPYVGAMAYELILDLPLWLDPKLHIDNWQTSAWEGATHF